MKRALVVRLGAIGDVIMMTPVLRKLKNDGYHVTVVGVHQGKMVLRFQESVDEFIMHDEDIPVKELGEYYQSMGSRYDYFLDLTMSIEGTLVPTQHMEAYYWDQEKRREELSVNFYDRTMELAGFEPTGSNGEIDFAKHEVKRALKQLSKFKGKYIVLWSLSGSASHKAYPHTEEVQRRFLERHKDAVVLNVGDDLCSLLEYRSDRVYNYSGYLPLRRVLALTKYVDLVVGTETGISCAAGIWPNSQIVMLTTGTKETISKYWKNCTTIELGSDCQPCHRIIYDSEICPRGKFYGAPICMEGISPEIVLNEMEKAYERRNQSRT
ncbi:MAG: glycosyltransferase family 9 protein [Candidatus Thorarchaeota archaeon]|jgi:ADP-heptose:LPS heptosyltransferase